MKKLKGMKILVTGGSGFIGYHLFKKLVEYGAVVDNYSRTEGVDITQKRQLKRFVLKKYDVIFHLAGKSGVVKSNRFKANFFNINTLASLELFDLIVNYSPKTKLILSGTRLEYGVAQYLPVDEQHPTFPISVYGLSKLAASQAAIGYYQKYGLKAIIFRTSNVYGPWHKNIFPGYNVISYFIDAALKNQDLTVFGKGDQQRDYIYMDDLIDTFIASMDQGKIGEIYNLGLGRGISFANMVELIVKKIKKGHIKHLAWPKDFSEVETGSYITNISKLKKDFGFFPQTSFEEGIEKTINHLR